MLVRRRPPRGLRLRGPRPDAGRVRARRPGELPDRGRRRRRAEPRHPARTRSRRRSRATWTSSASSAATPRCATASTTSGCTSTSTPTPTPEEIEALVAQSQKRSAVFDAITNPTNVTVDGQLSASRRAVRTTTVVIGAGHAGLAVSHLLSAALDRPRGPRARRGRQLLADRALGLAAAAHAQLAERACPASPTTATTPTAS